MTTATARRHVENALRTRLGIRAGDARSIVESWSNMHAMDAIRTDMRNCVAVMGDDGRHVSIHAPSSDGVFDFVADLRVDDSLLARWSAMTFEQAYGMPDGVVLRCDLELAEAAPTASADRADDPSDFVWIDGEITGMQIHDDRTLLVDALVDGEAVGFVKFAIFGSVHDVADYVRGVVGQASRLCVEDQRFDPVPGFEGRRVLEMIWPATPGRTSARNPERPSGATVETDQQEETR